MSGTVQLFADTVESVQVPIKTNSDPTGTAPQFALSTTAAVTPGSFTTGSWSGSYSSTTGLTTAVTATLGTAGSMTIATGISYSLWIKVTLGSEVAVWKVGTVRCP